MCDPVEKQIILDDRLESYGSFYDHDWGRQMLSASEQAPKLRTLVFDLTMSCKGISRTASLPLIAVDLTQSYSDGYNLQRLSESQTIRMINHIAARLDQTVVLSSRQRGEVVSAMLALADEFRQKVDQVQVPFPRKELWDSFAQITPADPVHTPKNEFRLALWASQRISYSAVFFAYEDFLVRCLSTHQNTEKRTTDRDFGATCTAALGSNLARTCWFGEKVQTAKRIRHSLVHAGGRITAELSNRRHNVQVLDDDLQILPQDVKDLFEHLKDCAMALTKWAAPLPEFQ